jgi:hypothetical protein
LGDLVDGDNELTDVNLMAASIHGTLSPLYPAQT